MADDGTRYAHCNKCGNGRLAVRFDKHGAMEAVCEDCPANGGDLVIFRLKDGAAFERLAGSMKTCRCAECEANARRKGG